MQRGTIYKHHGAWLLRYYDLQIVDGKRIQKRCCVRLAPANEDYPNKRSVLLLAEKHLAPINTGQLQPESSMTVVDFIEKEFLPYVQRELKPATYKNYRKDLFEKHLKKLLGDIRLRDFRTVTGQKILRQFSAPTVGNGTGRTTLLRAKAFLSSVFKYAKREGILDGENPMRDTSVPGRPSKFQGAAYSLSEIEGLLIATTGAARIAIATAALTGLRMSELRGLRWGDFDGENLHVRRSVWRAHIGQTKTEDSERPVPVLPLLKDRLEKYRGDAPPNAYIFAGEKRGASLNLPNLAARDLKPALKKAKEKDPELKLEWKGWHAFRRGLASNLYSLGVQPKVIQAILRHSDIGTTLSYYVQTPDEESRDALGVIESAFPFGL